MKVKNLRIFVPNSIAHVRLGAAASAQLSLSEVDATPRYEAVVAAHAGREQLGGAAVGADVVPAAGLRVSTAVGVEVTVGNRVHNTGNTAVGVDGFDVASGIPVQSIWVSAPLHASWVQSCYESITEIISN